MILGTRRFVKYNFGRLSVILAILLVTCCITSSVSGAGLDYSEADVSIKNTIIDDQEVPQVLVEDTVVARIRASYGGFSPEERAIIIVQRLRSLVRNEITPENLRTDEVNGLAVVMADDNVVMTADERTSEENSTDPRALASVWCDNIRVALGYHEVEDDQDEKNKSITKVASWYGYELAGRKTASGEIFDPNAYTAAHKSFPFGTELKVTYPRTDRSVTVRINDRGPFVSGRDIDLSRRAAETLGLVGRGVDEVKVKIVDR